MKDYLKRNSDLNSNAINDMFEYKESYAEQTTKWLNNQTFLNNEKFTWEGLNKLSLDDNPKAGSKRVWTDIDLTGG